MTMRDDPVRRVARTAAQRLESRRWPELTVEIEAVLDDRRSNPRGSDGYPDQYVDAISLAALIVAAADLAWSVYTELRTKTSKPVPTIIIQRLHVELPEPRVIESTERDRAIEVIVDEIIRSDDSPTPDSGERP